MPAILAIQARFDAFSCSSLFLFFYYQSAHFPSYEIRELMHQSVTVELFGSFVYPQVGWFLVCCSEKVVTWLLMDVLADAGTFHLLPPSPRASGDSRSVAKQGPLTLLRYSSEGNRLWTKTTCRTSCTQSVPIIIGCHKHAHMNHTSTSIIMIICRLSSMI